MVLAVLRSKKVTRRILIALLIIIVPAFVLWGAGSMTQSPELVGTIGRDKITISDFEESRQGIRMQIIFTYYANSEVMNSILKNRDMLNLMAWERLVILAAAKENKVTIDNDMVVNFISRHPLFQKDGVFNKGIYDRILSSALTIDPRQFEELVRENLQVRVFRQALLKNVNVTEEDVLEEYKRSNDRVDLSYVVIDRSLFPNKVDITDRQIELFYEKNKADLMTPAEVIVEYIEIPYENIAERNAATKKLEQVYSALISSDIKTFADTSAKYGFAYNKTTSFAMQDVIPGVEAFADFQKTAFLLRSGEISRPLYSSEENGTIYVLRKIEDIPEQQKSLDEVREDIRDLLVAERYILLSREKADELYSKTLTSAKSLEDISSEIRRGINKTGPITIEGYIEDVGPASKIVVAAQKSGQETILEPILTSKGAVLIRVDKILPADETALEEVKVEIHDQLLSRKQTKRLQNWFMSQNHKINLKRSLNEV